MLFRSFSYVAVIIAFISLSACGGGSGLSESSDNNVSPSAEHIEIVGAGIKGPLAFAETRVYKLDTRFANMYDEQAPIASTTTNALAQISGLSVPAKIKPPYILTIGGDNAIDLNTGQPPVIKTLTTVVTEQMLQNRKPVYSTPLTTLAFHMAALDSDEFTDATGFVANLERRASEISSRFAVNTSINIDILNSPVVIDASTNSVEQQTEAVYHRAAIEAFASKVHMMAENRGDQSSNALIENLALDLQSDGIVDNKADGKTIGKISPEIVNLDPLELVIPNTSYLVSDTAYLMEDELALIGKESQTDFSGNTITVSKVDILPYEDAGSTGTGSTGTGSTGTGSTGTGSTGTGSTNTGSTDSEIAATLPLELRGSVPESSTLKFVANKPVDAVAATVYLDVFDADHGNEGQLIINGNSPINLFGSAGTSTNNSTSANIGMETPVEHWVDGKNTLVFTHTSSGGYIINTVSVSFETSTASESTPPPEPSPVPTPDSGSTGSSASHFDNVPVTPGGMNFAWYSDATRNYPAINADDPVNWPQLVSTATTVVNVGTCSTLASAISNAGPGTAILIEDGDYNACEINFTKSGASNAPIIITSNSKATGGSGTVTFRNGSTFGSFKNASSHYIIGGLNFIGQSISAFELDAGATTTGTSGGTAYHAGSSNIRFTDNHFEGIGRESGSARGVILAGVRSNDIRIDHSVFINNYNHIRFKNMKSDGALISASKNARIDHNYFGPAATGNFLDGVSYEISAIQTCCGDIQEDSDTLTLTFEYNAVEHPRTKYTDPEVVEAKTAGMTVRNNIIWSNSAAVSLRYSHQSNVSTNYLVGTGITVHGAYHTITDNFIDGHYELETGIIMSRWGRRQPTNCTTLPPTHDNLIQNNTILNTTNYGMRIGDCDYGACRPITDTLISNNFLESSSGTLLHYNTNNEPGRDSVCDSTTISKTSLHDRSGDADGGTNSRIEFTSNTYTTSSGASAGSAMQLDTSAVIE